MQNTTGNSLSFETSRLKGVAPLAVLFEAKDGYKSDLNYQWNFGDRPDKTWAVSGKTKNQDLGFLGSHLYEEPGDYRITLKVPGIGEKEVTIQVQDPDQIYAGEKTACLSVSGDFSGCPAGARQITLPLLTDVNTRIAAGEFKGDIAASEISFWNNYKTYVEGEELQDSYEIETYSSEWTCVSEAQARVNSFVDQDYLNSLLQPGVRLLFHRDETYNMYDSLIFKDYNNGSMGAYGTCNSPTDQGICANNPRFHLIAAVKNVDLLELRDTLDNVRISDLTLDYSCGYYNRAMNVQGTSTRITLNKLKVQRFTSAIVGRTFGQTSPHEYFGLFNSHFEKIGPADRETYDPENDFCEKEDSPLWHTGDGVTARSLSEWTALWDGYKTRVIAKAQEPQCRSGGGNIIYFPAKGHMFMGNRLVDAHTRRAEHILRSSLAIQSLISHNLLEGPLDSKHTLKLHHPGDCTIQDYCAKNPIQSEELYPTEKVLIADNTFRSNRDINVSIGPGTRLIGERIQYINFTRNRLEATGAENITAINLTTSHSTIRDNTFTQPHRPDWLAVNISRAPEEFFGGESNRVLDNIVTAVSYLHLTRLDTGADDTEVSGNKVCVSGESVFVYLFDDTLSYSETENQRVCP